LEHEIKPSLSPQKPSVLLRLLHSLSSFLKLTSAKLSSGKNALITYYKAITQSKKLKYSHEKQNEEQRYRDAAPSSVNFVHQPNGKIEQQNRTDKNKNAEANMKPSFPTKLLRFFWRRRKSLLSKESIEILLAAAIAVATWAQVSVYLKQSQVMHEQVEQTQRGIIVSRGQLSAAVDALKASQQIFQIDQRPYLVVDENYPAFSDEGIPGGDKKVVINVQLKNIGKTPAIQVQSYVHLFSYRGKLLKDLTPEGKRESQREYIRMIEAKFAEMRTANERTREQVKQFARYSPGQDFAPTKTILLTPPEQPLILKTDLEPLRTGELALYVVGLNSYRDSYGNIYSTEFCYFFFGPYAKIWHICDSHNRNQ
jgi:hypothetical protein